MLKTGLLNDCGELGIIRGLTQPIITDNLKKAGWSLGCVAAIDSQGRTIWIAGTHRGDGKRFVVHADEILTAFLELEAAIGVASDQVTFKPRAVNESVSLKCSKFLEGTRGRVA